jgi:hypothetical protein
MNEMLIDPEDANRFLAILNDADPFRRVIRGL